MVVVVVEELVLRSVTRMAKLGGWAVDGEAGRRTRSRISQADLVGENKFEEVVVCLVRILTDCSVGGLLL